MFPEIQLVEFHQGVASKCHRDGEGAWSGMSRPERTVFAMRRACIMVAIDVVNHLPSHGDTRIQDFFRSVRDVTNRVSNLFRIQGECLTGDSWLHVISSELTTAMTDLTFPICR